MHSLTCGVGDYDGDKGLLIYDPLLVGPFKNADSKYADPPADINDNFKEKTNLETVAEFLCRRPPSCSSKTVVRDLQHYLLGGLRDTSVVGKYSNMHEVSAYIKGYFHKDTIRLAYL